MTLPVNTPLDPLAQFLLSAPAEVGNLITSYIENNHNKFLVDDAISKNREGLLNLYQNKFGELKNPELADRDLLKRLTWSADLQPKTEQKHANEFEMPTTFWERFKWLIGIGSQYDKKVQELYDRQLAVLNNTQPKSILQLKRLLAAYWHTNQIIIDYLDIKTQAHYGIIGKIFFACIKLPLMFICNTSTPKLSAWLGLKSASTNVPLGSFSINNQRYEVVGFAPRFLCHYFSLEKNRFNCYLDQSVHIVIYKEDRPQEIRWFNSDRPPDCHYFDVAVAERETHGQKRLRCEFGDIDLHYAELANENKVIRIEKVKCKDRQDDPTGSDRLIDQKLTQIMIEVLMQNRDTSAISLKSQGDELPVLLAGGFPFRQSYYSLEALQEFRSKPGNHLFPPNKTFPNYTNYYRTMHHTVLKSKDLAEPNVHFTRDGGKSWADIIKKNPILKPNVAVLPNFWAINRLKQTSQ